MAWRRKGAKPLPKPMVTFCQMDHQEHILMKFQLRFTAFLPGKCIWKCLLQNAGHFAQVSICWTTQWQGYMTKIEELFCVIVLCLSDHCEFRYIFFAADHRIVYMQCKLRYIIGTMYDYYVMACMCVPIWSENLKNSHKNWTSGFGEICLNYPQLF